MKAIPSAAAILFPRVIFVQGYCNVPQLGGFGPLRGTLNEGYQRVGRSPLQLKVGRRYGLCVKDTIGKAAPVACQSSPATVRLDDHRPLSMKSP